PPVPHPRRRPAAALASGLMGAAQHRTQHGGRDLAAVGPGGLHHPCPARARGRRLGARRRWALAQRLVHQRRADGRPPAAPQRRPAAFRAHAAQLPRSPASGRPHADRDRGHRRPRRLIARMHSGADAPPRIVVIGPGKIGCGHLAALFAEAGWQVVLAARNEAVVERLRAAGAFTVQVIGGDAQRVVAEAVLLGGDAFERAVAGADLVATAVGARNVTALGEPLARALAARGPGRPIDVWAVENGDAAPELEAALRDAAARERLVLPPLGVAGAISWRAVTSGGWKT